MFAYCNNNPVIIADKTGSYPTYSGITYYGIRFSGVPGHRLGFYGQIKEYWIDNIEEYLFENTTITSHDNNYSVSIPLKSINYKEYVHASTGTMETQLKKLNKLILDNITESSNGEISVDYKAESQLWGEMVLHAYGYLKWDIENCNEIDLEITSFWFDDTRACVADTRGGLLGIGINGSSMLIGNLYFIY